MKLEKIHQASPDTTDLVSWSKKDRVLFEIREDSTLLCNIKATKKFKILAEQKKKNRNYFEGRNVIKKVKIHCLKVFYTLIKDCIDYKSYGAGEYKLKLGEMNLIYQTFKYDISKYRNKVLLNLRMKDIMETFSNVNINEDTRIKEDKLLVFNFLMNCTWMDFLGLVKNENKELIDPEDLKDISEENITDYIKYIQKSSNRYKDRANLDDGYLRLYERIEERHLKEVRDSKMGINQFIISYNGF
jgi:hypothetical protein